MNCLTKHSNNRTKIIAYVKGNMGSFTARKLFFILFFVIQKFIEQRVYFWREMGITPLWCFPPPFFLHRAKRLSWYLKMWWALYKTYVYAQCMYMSNGNRPTQRWIFHQLLLLFKYRDGSQTLPSGDVPITISLPGFSHAISPIQHGFLHSRSSATNLLSCLSRVHVCIQGFLAGWLCL